MLGRKQRHQVVRSFPNRYLFSLTNKVTCLFPISCILEIILQSKSIAFETQKQCFYIINNMLSFSIQLGTKNLKIRNKFAVQPQLPY